MGTMKALHPPMLICLSFLLLSFLNPWFFVGVLVMLMDVSARYKEYKLLLSDYQYSHRYALQMRSSWCGRTAAIAALPEMKFVFYKMGYRWYNVLPDGFPLVFTKSAFWVSVLGINRIRKKK
jgi:hypothetical protein